MAYARPTTPRRPPSRLTAAVAAVSALWSGTALVLPAHAKADDRSGAINPATLPLQAATAPTASQPATTPSTGATSPSTHAASPATVPSTQAVYTRQTPREALKFFAAALRDGDASRLLEVVLHDGDAEQRMVTAIADMARALSALHAAAKSAFGVEAAARFTEDTAAGFEQTLARIDAAEVTTDNDRSTIRYADDKEHPYELRKVEGGWKVPASQFTQGAPASVLDRRVAELTIQTRVILEMGKEIGSGKHKTAEAAGLAWRSKMMSVLGDASSRPASSATRPSGK